MSERCIRFTVNLEMLSDWSISSGGGRQGSLDSVIVRDADGLPYLPATTLRGMWRDAAEQVAFGLDNGNKGRWCELVDHLFGSQPAIDRRGERGEKPIPSRLDLTDARLRRELREALRPRTREKEWAYDKAPLREALTLVKPGVMIEARSGRARANMLRFEEVARQDVRLTAEATIVLPDDDSTEPLICLAFAATRLVDRIGGNRRRGSGRCRMTVVNAHGDDVPTTVEDAIERLAQWNADKIPPLPFTPSGMAELPIYRAAPNEDFVVIPLDVAIDSPTVVASAVLGNVVASLTHIPGTFLIQGVAAILRAAGLDDDRFSQALIRGDIRVLPAYPQANGQRGLPTPLVFERKKDDSGGFDGKGRLCNRLHPIQEKEEHEETEGKTATFRPVGGWFACQLESNTTAAQPHERESTRLTLGETRQVTRTHNTVEDALQKPTQAVGGVYVYEAIAPGTVLKSELWLREALFATLKHEPGKNGTRTIGDTREQDHTITVGRAKKAGYGVVKIKPGPSIPPPQCKGGAGTFNLYFASDALLPTMPSIGPSDRSASSSAAASAAERDRIDASPAAFLRGAVHVTAGLGFDVETRTKKDSLRTGRSENWVARWGLPRPSYAVIRAGSVVVVEAPAGQSFSDAQLNRLQREGLGARRAEGFGHVLVNPDFLERALDNRELPKDETNGPNPTLSFVTQAEDKEFVERIENAALRAVIDFRAEQAAQKREQNLKWSIKGDEPRPNMSQLGNLRLFIADLGGEDGLSRAKTFVAGLKESERAKKWGDISTDGKKQPLEILEELFATPSRIWETIEVTDAELERALLVRSAEDVKSCEKRQIDAIVSFLFAAMRAHKRAIERPDDNRSALEQEAAKWDA